MKNISNSVKKLIESSSMESDDSNVEDPKTQQDDESVDKK
jgi:hypothetical protein